MQGEHTIDDVLWNYIHETYLINQYNPDKLKNMY